MLSKDLRNRSEILACIVCKHQTLRKLALTQYKAFRALKDNLQWRRSRKRLLDHLARERKEATTRRTLLAWQKHFKAYKKEKDKADFNTRLKSEVTLICTQYNKEIEMLREALNEANSQLDRENKNKVMMQENLKKAFMKGVCTMNFEAMNILAPSDVSSLISEGSPTPDQFPAPASSTAGNAASLAQS